VVNGEWLMEGWKIGMLEGWKVEWKVESGEWKAQS